MTPGRFASFRAHQPSPAAAVPLAAPAPGDGPLLVCGLGNPGAEYAATRHNVGAWCVALLARRHHVELRREGRVDSAAITIDGQRITIARPRLYMNESGGPVAQEARRLGVPPRRLLVVYDDLDLPAGRTRMRLEGGSGGNNGMKSIIGALGSTEFARIRIGIDRPYDGTVPVRDPDRVADWVLSRPGPGDRIALERAVERVCDAIERAVTHGYDAAMRALNEPAGGSGTTEATSPPDQP